MLCFNTYHMLNIEDHTIFIMPNENFIRKTLVD